MARQLVTSPSDDLLADRFADRFAEMQNRSARASVMHPQGKTMLTLAIRPLTV